MDPFVLNLGIHWLPAVDAFLACWVSWDWKHTLSAHHDNGDLWQQICQNSCPSKIPSLVNSYNYRWLAMGLRMRDSKPKKPPKPSFNPMLHPQDFFAIVDLYHRHEGENSRWQKEILSSFICSTYGTGFETDIARKEVGAILKGQNPYSASFDNLDLEEFVQNSLYICCL